jgi:hypothetical protein
MKIKIITFILTFAFLALGPTCAGNQELSVSEAEKVFLNRLNEAKADAQRANSESSRLAFAKKWIEHFDVKEMARQALAAVILDLTDKNDGDTKKTEAAVMAIFDEFSVKFKNHLINQYSSENRIKTFTDIDFEIVNQDQIDSETVQLKVLFKPKSRNDTPEFSITFDLIKRANQILISGISVEGSFDPIRNEREQVKSTYDQHGQDLTRMVNAY